MSKATTVQDYQLLSGFEEVRKILLQAGYEDRLERPLAYWALPNDRRLPLAFLGRTIGDLLHTSFEELAATPGIGQKKIGSLVKLLHRAVNDRPTDTISAGEDNGQVHETAAPAELIEGGEFNADSVSELVWTRWRRTVKRHGLETEKLGRVAPSLQSLPTVIWNTPLGYYAERDVAEIRRLKTHGEKRVKAVLEVFFVIHEMLGEVDSSSHLAVRLVPASVPRVERFVFSAIERTAPLTFDEVADGLARPLLDQLRIDAGQTVHELVSGRLGVDADQETVRMQSRRMGVTRARVYQLLDDCSKIADVRWPEGSGPLRELLAASQRREEPKRVISLVRSLCDLCFPDRAAAREDEEGDEP